MNPRSPELVVPDHRVWDFHALGTENQLALLQTREYLAQKYAALHGGSLSSAKADEIAAHFAHGRAFFAAAAEADELVTPLLQYYGVLAFSRAVILFRTRLREPALKKGHGLNAGDWSAAFAAAGQFVDAGVSIEAGTFAELCEAVQNTEMIDVDCYPERAYILAGAAPMPAPGAIVSFGAVLERMPQIRDLYRTATGRPLRNWEASVKSEGRGLVIDVMANDNAILPEARLRELTEGDQGRVEEDIHPWAEIPDSRSIAIHLPVESTDAWARHLAHVVAPGKYASFLAEPFDDGTNLPTIAMTFIASYVLGMLVRYYPSQWARMVSRLAGDPLLPVVRAVNGVVAGYPAMCLSALAAPLAPPSSADVSRAPAALGDPVLPLEGESDEQRQRREYKARLRRETEERQNACAHRRITKTVTVSGAVFTCDGCGKSGTSVDSIRGRG
ncbi:MAG: YaaC family protein [Gemmatimonadaceae bacterium]